MKNPILTAPYNSYYVHEKYENSSFYSELTKNCISYIIQLRKVYYITNTVWRGEIHDFF